MVIELLGGPKDGERITVDYKNPPIAFKVPISPMVISIDGEAAETPTPKSSGVLVGVYRRTKEQRSNGNWIYNWDGYA